MIISSSNYVTNTIRVNFKLIFKSSGLCIVARLDSLDSWALGYRTPCCDIIFAYFTQLYKGNREQGVAMQCSHAHKVCIKKSKKFTCYLISLGPFDCIENNIYDIAYAIDRTIIDSVEHKPWTIIYLDIYMPCALCSPGRRRVIGLTYCAPYGRRGYYTVQLCQS